jgi:hypothetical protein
MRRVGMLVTAFVAILAMVAVAVAQQTQTNTYDVTGSVSPTKSGKKKKPVPVKVNFNYQVGEANGLQPSAVKRYKISVYGVRAKVGNKFPKCTPEMINNAGNSDTVCPNGSQVGSGTIDNYVYNDADPSGAGGFACKKELAVYNSGKGKGALFVYGDPNECGGVGALPAFPIDYVKGEGGGTALQFEVPPTVLHPIAGLTVAVRSVQSTIDRETVRVKGKTRGYYESVKCRGNRRPIIVTFTTEQDQESEARANAKC